MPVIAPIRPLKEEENPLLEYTNTEFSHPFACFQKLVFQAIKHQRAPDRSQCELLVKSLTKYDINKTIKQQGLGKVPILHHLLHRSGTEENDPIPSWADKLAVKLIMKGADITNSYGSYKNTAVMLAAWCQAKESLRCIAEEPTLAKQVHLEYINKLNLTAHESCYKDHSMERLVAKIKRIQETQDSTSDTELSVLLNGTSKKCTTDSPSYKKKTRQTNRLVFSRDCRSEPRILRERDSKPQVPPKGPMRKRKQAMWDSNWLEVKESLIARGKGLFATEVFAAGEVVVGFGNAKRGVCPLLSGMASEFGTIQRGLCNFHDVTWTSSKQPLWAFMNHSESPNTTLVISAQNNDVDGEPAVYFKANACIKAGSELFFDYADGDSKRRQELKKIFQMDGDMHKSSRSFSSKLDNRKNTRTTIDLVCSGDEAVAVKVPPAKKDSTRADVTWSTSELSKDDCASIVEDECSLDLPRHPRNAIIDEKDGGNPVISAENASKEIIQRKLRLLTETRNKGCISEEYFQYRADQLMDQLMEMA